MPLGYDLGDRMLLPSPAETETVRHIFRRYLELKSLPALVKDLTANGIMTKRREGPSGKVHGGIPFNCSGLSHILKNRIYRGEIVHRGKAHSGEHEAIVDAALFKAVQDQLAANHHRHRTRKTRAAGCPLTGKIVDMHGQPMRPSFSYGRGSITYRYYVSECLLPSGKATISGNPSGIRLPALRVEKVLTASLGELLTEQVAPDRIFGAIQRLEASPTALKVTLDPAYFAGGDYAPEGLLELVQQGIDPKAKLLEGRIVFTLPMPPARKGRTITPPGQKRQHRENTGSMADLVRLAHRKLAEHNASPLDPARHSAMQPPTDAWTRERMPLGLLAPDIQKALLQGTAPASLDAGTLLGMVLPLDWSEQRLMLGLAR